MNQYLRGLRWLSLLAIVVGASRPPTRSGERSIIPNSPFVGTWRLVLFEQDSAGALLRRGPRPTGYLFYDSTGHMAAQIQPDRHRPSWPQMRAPTPDEAADAATGYVAYFGTYTVDENSRVVTHHREGALNLDVIDYARQYEFDGPNRLTLLPVGRPGVRLIWERVR